MILHVKSLRWIFIGSILSIIVIASIAFYFSYKQLDAYNKQTVAKNIEADGTDSKIQQIDEAVSYINENKTDIDKAATITANGSNYQYQDQIIADIRNIASASHLKVNSISFSDAASSPAGGAPSPTTATPSTGAVPLAAGAISGVKKQTATVSFSPKQGGKLYYQYLLDFLYKIQQNSTKFHTADVSLSTSSKNNQTVDLETLSIEVYVKDGAQ